MTFSRSVRALILVLLLAAVFFGLSGQRPAHAGGPLIVGGTVGVDAESFTWATGVPIQYRVDGGPLSADPSGTVVINKGIISNSDQGGRLVG